MIRSIFCEIKYMNGLFFSKARYMIGVGFQNTGSHIHSKIAPELPPTLPLGFFTFLSISLYYRGSIFVHCMFNW